MKTAKIEAKFVTPALLAGADQTQAELRAPSIRGQLRWWLKVLNFDDPEKFEADLFGSAEQNHIQRSQVIVRTGKLPAASVTANQTAAQIIGSPYDYFLWPLRRYGRGVIKADTSFSFDVLMRYQKNEDMELILRAFLLLGSLGTRSRRTYGSLWPTKVLFDGEPWHIPQNIEELKTELEKIFKRSNISVWYLGSSPLPSWKQAVQEAADFLKKYRCGSPKSGTPSQWGQNDHDAPFKPVPCVYRPALGLPLVQRYHDGKMIESKINGCERLASPVHFKVVPLGGGFVPLVIFLPDHMLKDKKVKLCEKYRVKKVLSLNNEIFDKMQKNQSIHKIIKFGD